jgi:hypothetical protein
MFADMLSELHHLDHAQQELIYLSSLQSSPFPIVSPEPFSTFDDKLPYCGSTPSVGYCKAVFVDWMRGVEPRKLLLRTEFSSNQNWDPSFRSNMGQGIRTSG